MERVITTDDLISIEAVKMSIGWGRVVESNSVIGLFNLLKVNPENTEEIDLVDKFLRGEVKIMDMIRKLNVEIKDGQEDQLEQEGEGRGEGTEGSVESDPWNEDEAD
jgi:hypothetical protein